MAEGVAERLLRGDPRALARALTLVESDAKAAAPILHAVHKALGRAHRVGITGPPGVGKSTLVGALAGAWRRQERKVGVLAVDPTSPFSGGALLGDRIRLGAHHGDSGVFIRSLASRGASGGLSLAVHDAADLLEAAGYDPVVIETVGVGQAEIDIARAADTTVLVLAPGGGDEIQAMKAGLLEAADLIVVNQADRRDVDRMVQGLEAGLQLRAKEAPRILKTIATKGEGVDAVRDAIDQRLQADDGEVEARRRARARMRIREVVDRSRAARYWETHHGELESLAAEVIQGTISVAGAAARLRREGEA